MLSTPIGRLRLVALVEAVSYLVLLFVAMPLKYVWDLPLAVRVAGAVHGFLFVAFVVALFRAADARSWAWRRSALVFATSLVPFATFWIDRSLREEDLAVAHVRS
ncbi:DUF3817 domain-containing protein [Sandaracinus amylolyticus]|uniref:DUF3817 domain-containing protein n=1 Tax=Sandaracinus amylolyticus TaxID=927083 RepID=UPI001F16D751|nr:DUF3817 domain-containing protein [Sandaracinus amylolyticus]UJR79115.1 Conserved membrane protein YdzA [Sandaracinus amylolyticus]